MRTGQEAPPQRITSMDSRSFHHDGVGKTPPSEAGAGAAVSNHTFYHGTVQLVSPATLMVTLDSMTRHQDARHPEPTTHQESQALGRNSALMKQYRQWGPLFLVAVVTMVTTAVLLTISMSVHDAEEASSPAPDMFRILVPRSEWLARPNKSSPMDLKTPIGMVVIQHTAMKGCSTRPDCKLKVKKIQDFHMDDPTTRWIDISYNFLVGGDGLVYEGRGWGAVGIAVRGWNEHSLSVAIIGTFTNQSVSEAQKDGLQALLKWGVDLGKLTPDYRILGACQLKASQSPGLCFMAELKKWDHWSDYTHVERACTE